MALCAPHIQYIQFRKAGEFVKLEDRAFADAQHGKALERRQPGQRFQLAFRNRQIIQLG